MSGTHQTTQRCGHGTFYTVLPFLIVPLQILASNLVFHTRAWSRESYYESVCSVFALTARKSYLVHAAHWRQVHFRPHRPLPRDISHMHTAKHTPILRTVLEIVVGTLCLGIPFLFVDRARYSTSVTLMTLPELDSIARIGGLVAILCSVLSMLTSFVSIFQYKSEMAQGAAQTAGEGFVLLPVSDILVHDSVASH